MSALSSRALVAGFSALLVAAPVALQGSGTPPAAAAAPIAPTLVSPVRWLPVSALSSYGPAVVRPARGPLGGLGEPAAVPRGVSSDSRFTAPAGHAVAVRRAVRVRAAVRTVRHRAAPRNTPAVRRVGRHAVVSRTVAHRKAVSASRAPEVAARRGLGAVVAYARAHVGAAYVHGATGPRAYDCSGLTMQAYRRAGVRLPHSSAGQAGRAYRVARGQARPGDLVVGSGHVGIYMGGGMMIDAGNPRVGVSYRRMYSGLHVERVA